MKKSSPIRMFLTFMAFVLCPMSLFALDEDADAKKVLFYRSMGYFLETLVQPQFVDVFSWEEVPSLTLLTLSTIRKDDLPEESFFKNVQLIVGSVISGYPDESSLQGDFVDKPLRLSLSGGYEGGIFLGARHNWILDSVQLLNSGNVRLIAGHTSFLERGSSAYGALGFAMSSGVLWPFVAYDIRFGVFIQLTVRADFLGFEKLLVEPSFPIVLGLHFDRGASGGLYVRAGYVLRPRTLQQGFQFVLGFSYQNW